jgi:hypothetical protein
MLFKRANRALSRPCLAAAGVLFALAPVVAWAQETQNPPQRIGNIWDSLPHQPTEQEVTPLEHESGVAPDAAQQRDINKELMQLDQELLNKEKTHPPTMPPLPPGAAN